MFAELQYKMLTTLFLTKSSGKTVVMLAKERQREHKKVDRKTYSSNCNKIQVNLVKQ